MRRYLLAATTLLAACGGSPTPTTAPPVAAPPGPTYRATLRWTAHGVPHIRAADLGSLGYGQGYAMARAHLCVMADQFVRVRGERARWFGAGADDVHADSDFANLHLGWHARATAMLPALSDDARALVVGFAAGYDRALADTPPARRPAPCRDGGWVQPIAAADVLAVVLSTSALASTRFLEGQIARAHPPSAAPPATTTPPTTGALPFPPRRAAGASNAWAIGAERTASGGGLLVANPHFPWEGDLAFFESHLTVPGDLDVYGVTLIGLPGVQIGTTADHAWSHTFSSSSHMALYRLDLDADSALRYRHGDEPLPIVPTTYTIDVLVPGPAGVPATHDRRRRTLYRTALGPMLVSDATPWEAAGGHAFTVRDVAVAGPAQLDEPLGLARARDRAAFERALALSGTPFVNTVYADAAGDALYVDGSRVPALSEHAVAGWQIMRKVVPAVEAAWQRGVVVLDGANPLYDLESYDPAAPGALPVAEAPRVLRRDFVMNANDSYRFTNLDAPETTAPHSPLYGEDEARPSPRTLANLALLRPGDAAAGDDGRFTLDEAAAALLSGRSFTAERLRDDVLAACGPDKGSPVARRRPPTPCDMVRAWDGRFATTSRGATVWRELMAELAVDGRVAWRQPFDRQAPRLTPDGLRAEPKAIVAALGAAVARLRAAGLDPGGELGDAQHAPRGAARVAVGGGDDLDGVANVVGYNHLDFTLLPKTPRGAAAATGLAADGYVVNYGSSFILAAELGPDGVRARALLTYGNSSDPASPWFRDQLEPFARGQLRPVLFAEADIAADPGLVTEELVGP